MDSLLAAILLSLLEGFFLQRTYLGEYTFRTVTLGAFGVNLLLLAIWNLLIYPYFITPLRHLPTVPVRPYLYTSIPYIPNTNKRTGQPQ